MPLLAAVWRHARGVLVAGHIVAIGLAATPSPDIGMNRDAWREPTVQAEFRAWSARLGVAPERFESALWSAAQGYSRTRQRVIQPFARYLEVTGAAQPWTMFAGPNVFPATYEVAVRAQNTPPDAWETLYRARSAEYRWRADFYDQERLRSMLSRYSWPIFAWGPPQACNWAAREIFRERPAAEAVRCRYRREQTPTPAEAAAHVEHPLGIAAEVVVRRTR
jgi:hypothetical protein